MGVVWPADNGLRQEQSPLHNMAQFAHREGIRYSMSGRSPDSRTPLAGECLPTPCPGAVTSVFALIRSPLRGQRRD